MTIYALTNLFYILKNINLNFIKRGFEGEKKSYNYICQTCIKNKLLSISKHLIYNMSFLNCGPSSISNKYLLLLKLMVKCYHDNLLGSYKKMKNDVI